MKLTKNQKSVIQHLMTEAGYSEADIQRGMEFAESQMVGIERKNNTARVGYVLAMSRVLYTDEQLEAGMRFQVDEHSHQS